MKHYVILWFLLMPISLCLSTRRIGLGNWQYWFVLVMATIMFEVGRIA